MTDDATQNNPTDQSTSPTSTTPEEATAPGEDKSTGAGQPAPATGQSAADSAASGEDALQELREQLTERERELGAAREEVLRAQAEMQNVHRRADQEIERARRFGIEKLVADLLPVADGLEQALTTLESGDQHQQAILDGVSITLKALHDTLARYGVEHVDPLGEPFDPNAHEAMAMLENPDSEHNTVLEVYRKGYRLNGRLVRPAMVVVNRLPK